ncbi:MAG TPA: TetR/AcrR family transcriptional regulator [Bacteroidales bacterium]|nr:TetR/AcrR family transcriptional regulator [Bacteroidales bacterium]
MDTRDRVIEEAAGMFRTYGIRAVTMDMLAARMGISKRTLYELFRDKDELLLGVIKMMSVKRASLIKHCLETSENVIEAIFMILDVMMEHFGNLSPAFKLDMKRYHNEFLKKMDPDMLTPDNSKEVLVRGIGQGIFREDIDIDLTDRCLKGLTKINEKEMPEDYENEALIRDFFINYLRGISTQKGLELIALYSRKRNIQSNKRNLQI